MTELATRHDQPATVRPIRAAETRVLRGAVLRPGSRPESLVYSGDDHPAASHAGAYLAGRQVGIATVYPEAPPPELRGAIPEEAYVDGASFRLRGMATLPDVRGTGLGRALLEHCFDHIRRHGASYLWCNARLAAVPFYERLGLTAVGALFEIESIGPHYVMWRKV